MGCGLVEDKAQDPNSADRDESPKPAYIPSGPKKGEAQGDNPLSEYIGLKSIETKMSDDSLQTAIGVWAARKFGDLNKEVENLKAKAHDWELKAENGILSNLERE
ncbi:hypothetical protein L2E82_18097 [Cichorium intybus]|uniref:Uncharacterized protein n=1 Tax=Cichorium intybus TaxID=13427 RepID=A0ACB9F9B0_CICIN|nr:hypothetical protein L2E82_18097 [Cichorium intybus]